jgi:hypothetical protein
VDQNRRKFLKIILFGGGAYVAGKVLGPLFPRSLDSLLAEKKTGQFKMIEDQKVLAIFDDSGEEVLHIDKGE